MRQFRSGKIRINAVCLLILFLAYQAGYTAFLHVHYVDGVSVVHSHPFHNTHGHTQSSFLSIGQATPLASSVDGAPICLLPFLVLLAVLSCAPLTRLVARKPWACLTLRAPPASFFIH